VNADWLGAPRLRTLRTIGERGIKTWRAFGAPSHFLDSNVELRSYDDNVALQFGLLQNN